MIVQDGITPAIIASYNGNTETLALLLLNNVNVNAATKVQQLKNFVPKFKSIINDRKYEDINLPQNYLTVFNMVFSILCAGWLYASLRSF